jgi:hypothetical protein
MDKKAVEEIITCLPQGRTLFDYFKDRYAVLLLSYFVENADKTVAECKRTPYARLLEKPLIKTWLATQGNGIINCQALATLWDNPSQKFLLTLTTWGNHKKYDSFYQTARAGLNLVLQLNFSNEHEQQYRRLIRPLWNSIFNPFSSHPIMQRGQRELFRETLAWVRMDIDFATDEVLIEEIQSDWVREVREVAKRVLNSDCDQDDLEGEYGINGSFKNVYAYLNEVFEPYARMWDEAALAAAIVFIRNELGIRNIFYYSYKAGAAIKKCDPPRSLYTELPRKFCFQKTTEMPVFLQSVKTVQRAIKRVESPYWYKLEF